MTYCLNNTFNIDEINVLRKIKGSKLLHIYTEEQIRENVLNTDIAHILLSISNLEFHLHIKETYTVLQESKEEFTRFSLELVNKNRFQPYSEHKVITNGAVQTIPFSWKEFCINDTIKSIELIRDIAEWECNGNIWKITTDVALIFDTISSHILIILTDLEPLYIPISINSSKEDSELINTIWSQNSWGLLGIKLDKHIRKKIRVL